MQDSQKFRFRFILSGKSVLHVNAVFNGIRCLRRGKMLANFLRNADLQPIDSTREAR
jgi:hypothetical protein